MSYAFRHSSIDIMPTFHQAFAMFSMIPATWAIPLRCSHTPTALQLPCNLASFPCTSPWTTPLHLHKSCPQLAFPRQKDLAHQSTHSSTSINKFCFQLLIINTNPQWLQVLLPGCLHSNVFVGVVVHFSRIVQCIFQSVHISCSHG